MVGAILRQTQHLPCLIFFLHHFDTCLEITYNIYFMEVITFKNNGTLTEAGKKTAKIMRKLFRPGRRITEYRLANEVKKTTGADFRPSDPRKAMWAGFALDMLVTRVIRGVRPIWSDHAPHTTYIVPRSEKFQAYTSGKKR